MVLEKLIVYKEGAVGYAEFANPPMNLLGPELVRDLVSLIPQSEADDALRVLVFKSRPRLFHFPRRRDADQRVPGGGGEVDQRSVDRPPFSLFELKPTRHHRADRGSCTRRRQRVRAGVRHALCRAGVGDFQSVPASPLWVPRRGRRPTPRAPHGSRQGARSSPFRPMLDYNRFRNDGHLVKWRDPARQAHFVASATWKTLSRFMSDTMTGIHCPFSRSQARARSIERSTNISNSRDRGLAHVSTASLLRACVRPAIVLNDENINKNGAHQ